MPPCRPCHNKNLTTNPQESPQLIKYPHHPHPTHPKIILNTPTYIASISQAFIHQHLPNLFHLARSRGDRVLQPLECFQTSFRKFGDEMYYALALEWVVTRVTFFARNEELGGGSSFEVWSRVPNKSTGGWNPENVMQDFYAGMLGCYNTGAYVEAEAWLDRGVGILEAIGNILRMESGTSYSARLMHDYLQTVIPFLSWAENVESRSTFRLLQAVYRGSGEDRWAVVRMCNNLGPVGRDDAAMEAYNQATMYNDRIAWEVFESIP